MRVEEMLCLLASAEGKTAGTLTHDEELAIQQASRLPAYKERAILLVRNILKNFSNSYIKKHRTEGGANDEADFRQNIDLIIVEKLSKWEPRKGNLTTFFGPQFDKICQRERNRTSPLFSAYYDDVSYIITRAKEELTSQKKPVTTENVISTIKGSRRGHYSEKAIGWVLSDVPEVVSIDALQHGADDIREPIGYEEEKSEIAHSVWETMRKMSYEDQLILRSEIELFFDFLCDERRKKRKSVRLKELSDALKAKGYIIPEGELRNRRDLCYSRFRALYRGTESPEFIEDKTVS